MNRLRVKCVKCGMEWEKDSLISWGPEDISSSLCDSCFMEVISPIIHKRQRGEGNLACFGNGSEDCQEAECKYRQWCFRVERRMKRRDVLEEHRLECMTSDEWKRDGYEDTR